MLCPQKRLQPVFYPKHITFSHTHSAQLTMSREEISLGSDPNMSMEKDALSDPEANHPDGASSPYHGSDSKPADDAEQGKSQWMQGFPLVIVMMALTIVSYLMLLDVSIVATVGEPRQRYSLS